MVTMTYKGHTWERGSYPEEKEKLAKSMSMPIEQPSKYPLVFAVTLEDVPHAVFDTQYAAEKYCLMRQRVPNGEALWSIIAFELNRGFNRD